MVETMLVDIKSLLVEKEDCDSGTVTKLREGLAQGGAQYRALRESVEALEKKLESASGAAAKKLHLKLGLGQFFLGHTSEAVENLRHGDTGLAHFYHGRALVSLQQYDDALKAFEKAEKSGYAGGQVQLQKAGIHRHKGEIKEAKAILGKLEEMASHNAEYHYQLGSCFLAQGDRGKAISHFEKAAEFDPGHTAALFQLGHANDLAGNDADAILYYEQALQHPPVHVGALNNLGVLYEDNDKYDKAVECYRRILNADGTDERARLFYKDAQASLTMYYSPEEEYDRSRFSQVLEIPVTDFELSVRSRNCLKKMNIRTLGDLTRVTEAQLLSSKNFGETSLSEIKDMMTSKGLRLGQSLEQGVAVGGGGPDSRFRSHQPAMSEQEAAILGKPVSELNLSVRARKCMNRLGIATLAELVQRTADDLLESKNFGMTSLNEVREKLALHGLTLRGD